MLLSSGYTASVDQALCQGCETCLEHCQFAAIDMADGTATISVEDCFGCGVCVDQCPEGAISLALDPAKGEPLQIEVLMEEARRSV